jgi:pyruvate/2-oxoglutarate dehydrogenase complex dihydrolipoamide dehydrogenase (E3) component
MTAPGPFDVIVLGAGPAGASAAITAAEAGRRVAVVDEQAAAGGQVWRAPTGGFGGKGDADQQAGDGLRRRLATSPATCLLGHRVWSAVQMEAGYRIDTLSANGPVALEAPALVVATGAHERVVPFPGWTTPGVIGLAAATVLLKSHGVVPGRRLVVAGCGPLLAVVAAGLVRAGAQVAAVVDIAPRVAWLARLPAILSRPRLAGRGLAWTFAVARAGLPVLSGHDVRRVEGGEAVVRVIVGPVDQGGAPTEGPERVFEADCLVVGHGLTTACEVTRLLRADHQFDRLRGGWVPVVDDTFQTSLPGLYAIGDGAGIRGQAAASLSGEALGWHLAGRTAEAGAAWARLAAAVPFSDAMAGLMAQRPAQVRAIVPEAIVCRCEDVTRAEIDAAVDMGARQIDQLKHFTRCGMGPCQGRSCADTVQELMAARLNVTREVIGQWTGRPPLRPVPLGEVIGAFSYDDIPIPEPAPL